MLLVGYMEGFGSERGIAWRCAHSISLRESLGYGLSRNPPDHSSVSRTRRRLSLEAHREMFALVLERLRSSGLLSGKTLGVDATTLEANAALRSMVRRDHGSGYAAACNAPSDLCPGRVHGHRYRAERLCNAGQGVPMPATRFAVPPAAGCGRAVLHGSEYRVLPARPRLQPTRGNPRTGN